MSIAVFASGSGTNFQAIVERMQRENWSERVSLLISDQPKAKALERAEKFGIPHLFIDPKQFNSKAEYERKILQYLQQYKIKWVILAGYMRLIGSTILTEYEGRIINIHPSLLPAFPGINAIGQAFDYPVKISGVTIHFIDEGMDTGPIIAQEAVPIAEDDTIETFTAKIQRVEHRLYPEIVYQLVHGKLTFGGKNSSDQASIDKCV